MTEPQEPAQRTVSEPTDAECSDEPKLTAEEWSFVEAMTEPTDDA